MLPQAISLDDILTYSTELYSETLFYECADSVTGRIGKIWSPGFGYWGIFNSLILCVTRGLSNGVAATVSGLCRWDSSTANGMHTCNRARMLYQKYPLAREIDVMRRNKIRCNEVKTT